MIVDAGPTSVAIPLSLASVPKVQERSNERFIDFTRLQLLKWGGVKGRSFWWRKDRDPYTILIVEVLLRQTRAATVVKEISDFVLKYPSATALADGCIQEIEKDLQPFGLYRQRARQLKLLGQALVSSGSVPENERELLSLPGVGPYTASAVRCFAFGASEPVVDVNLARIVERVFGLHIERGEPRRNKRLILLAKALLAGESPREMNWALLDLGALVCTARQPRCGLCPLEHLCSYNTAHSVSK